MLRIFFYLLLFSIFSAGCKNTVIDNDFEILKSNLFKKAADASELPIYADPPTSDYEDFKKGKFQFQIDSIEIRKINKYRKELESSIIQRIDSGYAWVYLAAYLRYESAIPKIKELLLKCDKFYGWEGPDYSKTDSYLEDGQYCDQMAYITAIEYISKKNISKAVKLTTAEYNYLKSRADKCSENNKDSLNIFCPQRWLLGKLGKK